MSFMQYELFPTSSLEESYFRSTWRKEAIQMWHLWPQLLSKEPHNVASAYNGKIQLDVKFATTVVLRHVSQVHEGKKVWQVKIWNWICINLYVQKIAHYTVFSCLERMPRDVIQARFRPVLHSVLIHHCVVCVYRDSLDWLLIRDGLGQSRRVLIH